MKTLIAPWWNVLCRFGGFVFLIQTNRTRHFLVLCFWFLLSGASAQETPVPSMMGFQARITVNGSPFTGTGNFKFALVDATGATTFWSHDNTSTAGKEPTVPQD
jgi:hypothetical protein